MRVPHLSPVSILAALSGALVAATSAVSFGTPIVTPVATPFSLHCRHSTRTDVGWLRVTVTPAEETVTWAGHYDYFKGNVDDVSVEGGVGPVVDGNVYALRDAEAEVSVEGDVLTVKAVSWLTHGRAPHEETVVASFGGYAPGAKDVWLSTFLVDGKDVYPGSGVCSVNGDIVVAP